jgi:hypothetical protein
VPVYNYNREYGEYGKVIGILGGSFNDGTLAVPPGTYMLEFGRHLESIEVKAGPPTEIFLGAIRLSKRVSAYPLKVYHQRSKKSIDTLGPPPTLVVPAGTYELRRAEIGSDLITVVVNAGETVILE